MSKSSVSVCGSILKLCKGNHQTHFHRQWLQSHLHVHPSSGQLLKYGKGTLRNAFLVERRDITQELPPPTPPGSLLPIGGIYGHSEASPDDLFVQLHFDNETSYLDWNWLWEHRYDNLESSPWKHKPIIGRNSKLQRFSFEDLVQQDSQIGPLWHALATDGAALVEGAKEENDISDDACAVARIGRILSGCNQLSHGVLYGNVFEVISQPNSNNVAYTAEALPPHQDLCYYQAKPGLQLLHCLRNSKGDGQSVLVDALGAAQAMQQWKPEMVQLLAKIPVTFCKQREEVDMVYRRPHIELVGDEITAVHWSPPFMGPLRMNFEEAEAFLDARDCFQAMLDDKADHDKQNLRNYAQQYTWEYSLQPGEILVFNNQRLLHGRREFQGSRHFRGCYVDLDHVINQYRVWRREQQLLDDWVSWGNGSAL